MTADTRQVNPRQLVFFAGPMDSGKSTLALQMAHTQSSHDRKGWLFTSQDRGGEAHITSRIGLDETAIEVDPDFRFLDFIRDVRERGERIDFLVCDEAQFYTPAQIDDLALAADEWDVDVFCFGLLTDCLTELWAGSKRLVEIADRVEMTPIQPLCWCGRPGTHTARVIDGVMVLEGPQVVVGDMDGDGASGAVQYQVLCRVHHRLHQAKPTGTTLSPAVLPFD